MRQAGMREESTSDKFSCCVTVEDIRVTLSASSSLETLCWDEIRVSFEREGVAQYTRWLSPPLAVNESNDGVSTSNGVCHQEVNFNSPENIVEVSWSRINNPAFMVQFKHDSTKEDHSLEPGYERPVQAKNLQYLADPSAVVVEGKSHSKVCPKTIRPLVCWVECRKNNTFSLSGGVGIERKPTSSGVETVSAYYAKSTSLVSALLKKAKTKLSHERTNESSASLATREQNERQVSNRYPQSKDGCNVYVTRQNGIDLSEAYNAPGGRQHFSLQLCPFDVNTQSDTTTTPIALHFTLVAHFPGTPLPLLRNYNSNVILLDQIVLDVTDANRRVTGKRDQPGVSTNQNSTGGKVVEAYGFGFTSNTATKSDIRYSSPFMTVSGSEEEGGVKLIDFSLLHPSRNEREISKKDLMKNPTSVCIVSSLCKWNQYKRRIGNRVVSISRFKTALDGLCKPSYKCQLVMGLLRRYDTGEVEVEQCANPVDLSSIINREYYPDKIRQVFFSKGEVMNFRLRRRCFTEPAYHHSESLMPYDYDNTGIESDKLDVNDADTSPTVEEDSFPKEDCTPVVPSKVNIPENGKNATSAASAANSIFTLYNNYEDRNCNIPIRTSSETDMVGTLKPLKAPPPSGALIVSGSAFSKNRNIGDIKINNYSQIKGNNNKVEDNNDKRDDPPSFLISSQDQNVYSQSYFAPSTVDMGPTLFVSSATNAQETRLVNPFQGMSEEGSMTERRGESNALPVVSFSAVSMNEAQPSMTSTAQYGVYEFGSQPQEGVELTPMDPTNDSTLN